MLFQSVKIKRQNQASKSCIKIKCVPTLVRQKLRFKLQRTRIKDIFWQVYKVLISQSIVVCIQQRNAVANSKLILFSTHRDSSTCTATTILRKILTNVL